MTEKSPQPVTHHFTSCMIQPGSYRCSDGTYDDGRGNILSAEGKVVQRIDYQTGA